MRNPFRKKTDSGLKDAAIFRSVATRRKRHMRHRWQWYLAGLVAFLILLGSGAAYLYVRTQRGVQLPSIPEIVKVDRDEEPFVVVLVGSDSRDGLTKEEQKDLGADPVESQRADTLIVARVDPDDDGVMMVQFPRDLYVKLPDGGEGRINSALEKGERNLIRTVKDVTGLPVNMYAQVNIAGFRDIVDAIGGVELCITEPVPFDSNTGIEIKKNELGLVKFDGARALRYVRSRKVFEGGDFARIQNQQKFLSAALDKILSAKTFLNPLRIKRLLDAAGKNLRMDKHTTLLGLRKVGERFKSFDPNLYEVYTAPNLGPGMVGDAAVVLRDDFGLKKMFAAIANDVSPAEADGVPNIDPSSLKIGVYNGIGPSAPNAAARSARALREAMNIGGKTVEVAVITDADRSRQKDSTIRYQRPKDKKKAEFLAAAIPGADVREGSVEKGLDVAVIVGKRFRTQRVVQFVPLDIPKPSEEPEECKV